MPNSIQIAGRKIGRDQPPYIIAELSGNHNGDLNRALETIQMAAESGADAIKIQSYTADTMTIQCDKPEFKIQGGLWDGYTLYELYKWAHTPFEWHEAMFSKAADCGITMFSSPFDETAVDLLQGLKTPAYKIASFELTDLPLIKYVAQTGRPMIMSTGLANMEEIEQAMEVAKKNGCTEIVLLHCISGYPTPVDQSNLATIQNLADTFDCVIGLSDHTMGTTVSIAAVALGACVIEKHVTLSRAEKGPDSEFSLEPDELKMLCKETKKAWSALGQAGYERKKVEESNAAFRRSLYFVKSLSKGDTIKPEDVRRIRPGFGLAPKYYDQVIGQTLTEDVERGTAVQRTHLSSEIK